MELTRKEKLLIYCLGRKTIVYEAAEAWTGKKGTDPDLKLGPWYACKTELINEGLIREVDKDGRKVIIEADLNNVLNSAYPSPEAQKMYSYMFKRYIHSTFKKYIQKIMDLVMDVDKELEGGLFKDYSRSDILFFFMLVSMLSCDRRKLKQIWRNSDLGKMYNNIMTITKGDSDFQDFPKPNEWKKIFKWNFDLWVPKVYEAFNESERKELCFYNLLAKSKKRIKRFIYLIYELLPEKAYKNYVLSQVKLKLKVENSICSLPQAFTYHPRTRSSPSP
jgi:hypothetical protein